MQLEVIVKTLYWFIRYFVAKRNKDVLIIKFNSMKVMDTPLFLKWLGLELIETACFSSFNKSSHNRLLIRRKSKIYDMSAPITVWRISGDDINPDKTMIVWECNV